MRAGEHRSFVLETSLSPPVSLGARRGCVLGTPRAPKGPQGVDLHPRDGPQTGGSARLKTVHVHADYRQVPWGPRGPAPTCLQASER